MSQYGQHIEILMGVGDLLVSNDYVGKEKVVFVKEDGHLKEVKKTLMDSGFRCIPVLDEAGVKYVGNLYEVDLLKYENDHPSLYTPLDHTIIADQGEKSVVKEDDPFFKVFSNIRQIPFLAVVNDEKEFLGIITNGNVIQVLENAWGVHNGKYSLTVGTVEYKGALHHMLEIINKYCSVQSVVTLNNDTQFVRRICIVLPEGVSESTKDQIVNELEEYKFTVTHVEKLN